MKYRFSFVLSCLSLLLFISLVGLWIASEWVYISHEWHGSTAPPLCYAAGFSEGQAFHYTQWPVPPIITAVKFDHERNEWTPTGNPDISTAGPVNISTNSKRQRILPGIEIERGMVLTPAPAGGTTHTMFTRRILVSCWLLVIATIILPAVTTIGYLHRKKAQKKGPGIE